MWFGPYRTGKGCHAHPGRDVVLFNGNESPPNEILLAHINLTAME